MPATTYYTGNPNIQWILEDGRWRLAATAAPPGAAPSTTRSDTGTPPVQSPVAGTSPVSPVPVPPVTSPVSTPTDAMYNINGSFYPAGALGQLVEWYRLLGQMQTDAASMALNRAIRQAELSQQAQSQTIGNRLELARMFGGGNLKDYLSALYFTRGQRAQPETISPDVTVAAPNIEFAGLTVPNFVEQAWKRNTGQTPTPPQAYTPIPPQAPTPVLPTRPAAPPSEPGRNPVLPSPTHAPLLPADIGRFYQGSYAGPVSVGWDVRYSPERGFYKAAEGGKFTGQKKEGGKEPPGVLVGERGPELLRRLDEDTIQIIPIMHNPMVNTMRGYQDGGQLSVNNLPIFEAARRSTSLPAFQQFGGPVTLPEVGITTPIPAPFQTARTFQRSGPREQSDLLDFYRAAGLPPDLVLGMIYGATPGFRQAPFRGFAYA